MFLARNFVENLRLAKTLRKVGGCFHFLKSKTQIHQFTRRYHEITDQSISSSAMPGINHLKDARLNKGLAFTLEERQVLGIHGLQPPVFKTQDEQLELCKIALMRYRDDLNKYIYLAGLLERHEQLFFRLLSENIETMMRIVYTPTVGLACMKYGLIYQRPRGLFVTINDRHHVLDIIKNWPELDVRAIVVTDGERILGLGDLGAQGMGIPIGKLSLYTALAGIKPHQCLPIVLDVGTNNKDLMMDPLYLGLHQPRASGKEYDDFIDEFMEAVKKRFGRNTLIQFEDFANHNAFRLLQKYRDDYCVFNDDIQGTAAAITAGLLASERLTLQKLSDHKLLFVGAGSANLGIADLCVKAMMKVGISEKEARDKIFVTDIGGLLTKGRDLSDHQKLYAKDYESLNDLEEIVEKIKPSVLIGASTVKGIFTPAILQRMADFNDTPMIFALSNPTDKAECTAEEAYNNTEGRCIFASGSPFDPVEYEGRTFHPGQSNNAYIFPGIALGVIASGASTVTDEMFLIAAETVAEYVTDIDLEAGSLYPALSSIRECSFEIAKNILEYAYDEGLASLYPEPKDKSLWLQKHIYNVCYSSSLPVTYKWPDPPRIECHSVKQLSIQTTDKI